MTDKQKNLVIRSITGVFFVVCMVSCFLNPRAMVILFALITGLSIWEYCGLVNQKENVTVNRFISTVAGVYFFLAVAGFRMGIVGNFVVFVPYLLTILYLFISELYTGNKDAINDWAYTMLSQLYIALPFSMINVLSFETSAFDGQIHYDMLLPLSIFIFLWTNDTGAYCSGSLFGKHKLFPRISPAKSWEGSIGLSRQIMRVSGGGLSLHQDHRLYCQRWRSPPSQHSRLGRFRSGCGILRHMGRFGRKPLQAYPRSKG